MDTIVLKNEHCQAEVMIKGAELSSFTCDGGREVMWTADKKFWGSHAPVLFPICGSVPGDTVRIGGVSYPMKKHGFSRKVDYTVCAQTEDSVDLVLTDSAESRAMYPFAFEFHAIYSLNDKGWTTTLKVVNRSERVMPFCCGGHPGFNVPMEDGARFEDYELRFDETESGRNMLAPTGGLISGSEYLPALKNSRVLKLEHELFDTHDALIFPELRSRGVNLVNRSDGHGLRFTWRNLEVLAVWTKPGMRADYLCLEPWHGMPSLETDSGDFESKSFVTMLQPGDSWSASYSMELI